MNMHIYIYRYKDERVHRIQSRYFRPPKASPGIGKKNLYIEKKHLPESRKKKKTIHRIFPAIHFVLKK